VLVLEVRSSGCHANSIGRGHRLDRKWVTLILILYLEVTPSSRLSWRWHELRLVKQLDIRRPGIARGCRAMFALGRWLGLPEHQAVAGAVLLLLSMAEEVLLILQVNPGEVRALDDLRLIVHDIALVLRAEALGVVQLVDAVAQILIELLLAGLIPSVSTMLCDQYILLVLLLEQLFVDLGNVLRNDLGVRVRLRRRRWQMLEGVLL